MPRFLTLLLTLGSCILSLNLLAQDAAAGGQMGQDQSEFQLFENLDSALPNNRASSRNQNVRSSGTAQASPVFTLVATSRIGSKQTALLKHLDGDIVKVPLTGAANPIPGHDLYSVVHYGAGQVAVRYPATVPCGDFADQGISCDSQTNIATLRLRTADAIVRAQQVEIAPAESAELAETALDTPRNPFAALRDRARDGNTADAPPPGRFQPRRIDPADVPPGMRVVSTPFGDRLVENN
jgi:hypothetical protein